MSKKFGTSIEVDGTIKAKQGTAAGEVVVLDSTGMIPADKVPVTDNGGTVDIEVDSVLSATSTNPVQNRVVTEALNKKQPTLVSGTNIKTVNGKSLLGTGNIEISEGSDTGGSSDISVSTLSENALEIADANGNVILRIDLNGNLLTKNFDSSSIVARCV